jgi:hypothetical protein
MIGKRFAWLLTIVVMAQAIAGQAMAQATALPGSNVMISPVGGGFLTPRPLVSQDLYQGGSCPSGQFFYNNAGVIGCTSPGGAGTVTSVGQTFTGGLISVSGSPVTGAGVLALTVAGTSGGIPYFSSSSAWASSGQLGLNGVLIGGGSGGAPSSIAAGTSNQVLRGATGSPPAFGGLASQDLYQAASCPSGQAFINNAGAIGCTAIPPGTVTSVSWTGGIVSIATPTSTPAFTIAGLSGGIPYFSSSSTWASSGVLAANQLVLGGGAGLTPATLGSTGTATQVLHGNASGAPSFTAITSADVTAVFASPPPHGNTVPNTVFATTLSATGLSTLANTTSTAAANQAVSFAGSSAKAALYWNITAASAASPEIGLYSQITSATGSASGNGPLTSAWKMAGAFQTIGNPGTANIYGVNIQVIMNASVGNFSMSGLEVDCNNQNEDYPEGGAGGAVGVCTTVAVSSAFPLAAAINVGTVNTTTYAFHDLIYVAANAWTIKDYTIHDAAWAQYSYYDNGQHGAAGFWEAAATPIGFLTAGTKTTAAFEDTATTPYGLALVGTYSTAALTANNLVTLTSAAGGTQLSVGTKATAASATPTRIAFDGSYSSVGGAVASAKIDLLGAAGGYAIGVSAGSLDLMGPTFNFWNSGNREFAISGTGHASSTGPAPVITACGTGPATGTGSNDHNGFVTEGTTATGCTITFQTAYANPPSCVVVPATGVLASFSYTVSASALVITNTSGTGAKMQWHCMGV